MELYLYAPSPLYGFMEWTRRPVSLQGKNWNLFFITCRGETQTKHANWLKADEITINSRPTKLTCGSDIHCRLLWNEKWAVEEVYVPRCTICENNGIARLELTFWNLWGGLEREICQVAHKEGNFFHTFVQCSARRCWWQTISGR